MAGPEGPRGCTHCAGKVGDDPGPEVGGRRDYWDCLAHQAFTDMELEMDQYQDTRVMDISFLELIIHKTWYLPDASLGIWRASGLNKAREEEGEEVGAVETSR